jgi:hypothetical protein
VLETGNDSIPLVGFNSTAGPITFVTVTFPNNVLIMHPPDPNLHTVIRWTAPTAGGWYIDGFFEVLDVAVSGVSIDIVTGSNVSAFTGNLIGAQFTTSAFSSTLNLANYENVYLLVGTAGEQSDGSTGLQLSITEPARVGLVAAVAAALLWFRRRKTA